MDFLRLERSPYSATNGTKRKTSRLPAGLHATDRENISQAPRSQVYRYHQDYPPQALNFLKTLPLVPIVMSNVVLGHESSFLRRESFDTPCTAVGTVGRLGLEPSKIFERSSFSHISVDRRRQRREIDCQHPFTWPQTHQ